MAQQTAVEWLVEQLKKQGFLYDLDIEAAKQMEKEQIEDAYKAHSIHFRKNRQQSTPSNNTRNV